MSTHTYAVMEISQSAFDEIKQKLEAAGYQHAIHDDDDKLLIDMHGIAVSPIDEIEEKRVAASTVVVNWRIEYETPRLATNFYYSELPASMTKNEVRKAIKTRQPIWRIRKITPVT
jgi:hypothetical protein